MKSASLFFVILIVAIPAICQSDIASLEQKAAAGDVQSQNRLGVMYASGDGVPQNFSKAMHWFGMAAEKGDAEGQYNVGVMHENGEGVKRDCPEAAKWYAKAARQNHIYAIDNLIAMYGRENCLKSDDTEVARLTKQLADLGSIDAQLNLGTFYAMGRGVPKDEAEAGKWYTKAAEAGQPTAQFVLGQWYRDGRGGIAQDYVTAYKWFALAVYSGSEVDGRNFLKTKLTTTQIADAEQQAATWRQRHSADKSISSTTPTKDSRP